MPYYYQGGYFYGLGFYGGLGYGGPGILYKEPLPYYLNLFTSQYKLSPKLQKWAELAFQPIDDLTTCLTEFTSAFDIDFAIGRQLDAIGLLIGVSRIVGFQPSGGVSPVLDDTTYRILLKARIAWNEWNGKTVSLYPIWLSLFPSGRLIIHDNQDMTATIILSGSFTSIIEDLITNGYIVPRPEGVNYTYTFANLPIFGADQNNAFIAGADLGHAS